jgi:GAF domain-containing protein
LETRQIQFMTQSLVTDLEHLVESLANRGKSEAPLSLAGLAERIALELAVQNDEVAILSVSTRWRSLQFLVPEKLSHIGSIPLSNPTSLAARTARESRPEIVNDFTSMRHASFFEVVPLAGRETAEVIQKIVSAPILSGKKVVGVIQVCRKGRTKKTAGPDFTASDLGKILAVCSPLGKLLHHYSPE